MADEECVMKLHPKKVVICHVVSGQCEAPAGWRTLSGYAVNNSQSADFTCAVCGERMCEPCSKLVKKRRVCLDCVEEQRREKKR